MAVTVDRFYLRIRDHGAWRSAIEPVEDEYDFSLLQDHQYCLLVTFRRNGEAVPTPVWFGLAGGRLYVRSEAEVGKVKRIRRDPHIHVAPCTFRGKPLGAAVEGRARVLPPEESKHAERVIAGNYGLGRRLYEKTVSRLLYSDLLYIEITPGTG